MYAAFLVFALIGATLVAAAGTSLPTVLSPGQSAECKIQRGESHRYAALIPAGHCALIRLRQHSIDVWLKAYSPSGAAVLDLNWDKWGVEPYSLCAESAGQYVLEVQAATGDSNHGSYALTLTSIRPRPPAQLDVMRAQALAAPALSPQSAPCLQNFSPTPAPRGERPALTGSSIPSGGLHAAVS